MSNTLPRSNSVAVAAVCTAIAAALSLSGCQSTAAQSADKNVIRIMTIGSWTQPALGTSNPEYPAGIQAAADAQNARGGIHGKKIEVDVCSDGIDPNVARSCATRAVREGVVAVVGFQSGFASSILPILDRAGIPVLGAFPLSSTEIQNPSTFTLTGGVISESAGAIYALKKAGATRVAYVYPSGLRIPSLIDAMKQAAKDSGVDFVRELEIPQNTSDLSAVVASATADGVDGVFGFGADEAAFIQAFRTQAPKVKLATTGFNLTTQVTKSLGPVGDGVLLSPAVVPYNLDAPGTKQFRQEMATYEPNQPLSLVGEEMWLSFHAFAKVAEPLSQVNSKSLAQAYGNTRNLDLDGVVPAYSTTAEGSGQFARMFNPQVYLTVMKSGQFQPLQANQSFTTSIRR